MIEAPDRGHWSAIGRRWVQIVLCAWLFYCLSFSALTQLSGAPGPDPIKNLFSVELR